MFIKFFQEINNKDIALAGGKGASLGEMTKVKLPIPPGFVVVSSAFNKFLEETGLLMDIKSITKKINYEDFNSVSTASEKIRDLIKGVKFPQDIAQEIREAFESLDTKYVAVRSSATAEDSEVASWAGELETFLNITEVDLLESVKNCWSSLFTPRAIFYRYEKKLNETQVSVAVVVQKMIQSDISGICFTVHPVTEDRNQMVIEAGHGLGEAIVGGLITPDTYIIDKEKVSVKDVNISEQNMMIAKNAEGKTLEVKVPQSQQEIQKLPDAKILELARICKSIENHYGRPQDIEWAMEKNVIYITQSRPITTLSSKSDYTSAQESKHKTNIDYDIETAKSYIENNVFDIQSAKASFLACDIVFSNYAKQAADNVEEFPILFYVDSQNNFKQLTVEEKILNIGKKLYSLFKENGLEKIEEIKNDQIEAEKELDLAYKYINSDEDFVNDFLPKFNKWWEYAFYLEDKGVHVFSQFELLLAKRHNIEDVKKISSAFLELDKISIFSQERLFVYDICKDVMGDKEFEVSIVSGSMGAKYRSKLQKHFSLYRKKYFYFNSDFYDRNILTFDDFYKKIKSLVLEHSVSYFNKEIKKIKSFAKSSSIKQEKYTKILSEKELELAKFNLLLIELSDIRKVGMMKSLYYFFDILHDLAKKRKVSYEDLSLLNVDELSEFVLDDILPNLQERKDEKFGFCYKDKRFLFLGKDANDLLKLVNREIDEMKGSVACRGNVVKGRVSIVKNPKTDKFENGDILVTTMTRIEFVSIMHKASAIITDEGGVACHAAIVSRELGIPCIIGAKIATKLLKNGDIIEVDTNKGLIRIIDNK